MRNPGAVAVLVTLLLQTTAMCAEWRSDEHKFAITYPDGEDWGVADERPDPSCVLLLVSSKGEGAVYVNVTDVGKRIWLGDKAIAGFERGALTASAPGVEGVRKISGARKERAGVPGYELVAGLTVSGEPMKITSLLLAANSRSYTVNALVPDKEGVSTDAIRKITDSFRFTSRPDLHEKPEPFAYRIGQLVGGILMNWICTFL
ncbi:MAG: hypothetical protein ACYTKD_06245 [Planctomycetota bacterium]|jgi:hypothetical protein